MDTMTKKSLPGYLSALGFNRVQVNSENDYYTSKNGRQIKINKSTGIISLLDSSGNVVDFSNFYTEKQINNFIKTETYET